MYPNEPPAVKTIEMKAQFAVVYFHNGSSLNSYYVSTFANGVRAVQAFRELAKAMPNQFGPNEHSNKCKLRVRYVTPPNGHGTEWEDVEVP